jgi:hypothetical protein
LRKSLKKFDLNLKRNGLKMKFEKEKEKKENLAGSPFSPDGPTARRPSPCASPPLLLSFFFFSATLTPGPRL